MRRVGPVDDVTLPFPDDQRKISSFRTRLVSLVSQSSELVSESGGCKERLFSVDTSSVDDLDS